ncbi:MAG: PQQ-binding-like beta-propeller repeat protein [Chitinophagaceae bacterium]
MKSTLTGGTLLIIILIAGTIISCNQNKNKNEVLPDTDWPVYGGNKAGNRSSDLDQVNLNNVKDLRVAWTYQSNDADTSSDAKNKRAREIQCQPIVVKGVLYGTNSTLKLFAADAATGKELWKFDPFKDTIPKYHPNRGVIYWENGNDKRIIYSAGQNLFAVNALTGQPVTSFGENGKVNLHEGLSINFDASNLSITGTTPGIIYKNTLVMGSSLPEGGDAAPGYVRGFDVVTGKLKWTFHTIPLPGEFGYDTWPKDLYKKLGATNNWSGLTVDEKRGAVYFGTGSPASDFYGGIRAGTNLFSDCIMSLDAETGKMNWYFQTIHHDLWDRDIPCPPNLITVKNNGKMIDAVVQATKDGLVYVLDRDKGTSLFPIEERPVPTKGLPGEQPWPTQQYPVKPLPFDNQQFSDSDITNISPASHDYIKKIFDSTSHSNKFDPPSLTGTVLSGYSGGAEWGGNAIDPDAILYQNANHAPWILKMISREDQLKEIAKSKDGKGLYMVNCSACHGADRKGNGKEIPALLQLDKRLNGEMVYHILQVGQGRMPSFQNISSLQKISIINFLFNIKAAPNKVAGEHADNVTATTNKDFPYQPAYVGKVWDKLRDQDDYPGIKPPWGTLNAIDLNTGDYLWRVPLGEYPELTKKGIPITGTESYGGPLVTAGGLVFIAATRDERIRAFDKKTGKVVWEYQLPAGGFATPVTYMINGKQYITIAVGGGRGLKAGGMYMAFALPDKDK